MRYKKYIVLAFLGALFLPLLSAKSDRVLPKEDTLVEVVFIELEPEVEFGFDTTDYLPEEFDPFTQEVMMSTIHFVEDDTIELGFDTEAYLPENFDPYGK